VLPQYRTPDADIYAIYPQHQHQSARIRTLVAFLTQAFERFALHRGERQAISSNTGQFV
jgi:DNA-binding transcriptional LysR family regulator